MRIKVTYGPMKGITRGEQHRRRQALIERKKKKQQNQKKNGAG